MDKDYMTMTISLLKDIEKNYVVACTEASSEKLFKIFKKGLDDIALMQRKTFEIMNKNKMYNLKNVQSKEITSAYDTLMKEYKKIKMPK